MDSKYLATKYYNTLEKLKLVELFWLIEIQSRARRMSNVCQQCGPFCYIYVRERVKNGVATAHII